MSASLALGCPLEPHPRPYVETTQDSPLLRDGHGKDLHAGQPRSTGSFDVFPLLEVHSAGLPEILRGGPDAIGERLQLADIEVVDLCRSEPEDLSRIVNRTVPEGVAEPLACVGPSAFGVGEVV